jgi:DNA-directed RNA polymerase subunit H (RpoH/RPB5)
MSDITNVMMNNKEKISTCVTNLFLMFLRRKYFDTDNTNKINNVSTELNENNISYIKGDNIKVGMYVNNIELKNISSGSDVDEFLSKNIDTKKFIIVKSFSKKVFKQVKEYKNSEIFHYYEFLEDIPSKTFIPEHILMKTDELNELKKTLDPNKFPKIFNTDMMSRYFNAQINDVFRIKRYNLNSGISTYYRTVVNDPDIYFLK